MWTAVLYLDGEPVTGELPIDLYDAATIMSPLMASWLGGPVSVAKAVASARVNALEVEEPTLFDEVA